MLLGERDEITYGTLGMVLPDPEVAGGPSGCGLNRKDLEWGSS